jgi:hypothetical protein
MTEEENPQFVVRIRSVVHRTLPIRSSREVRLGSLQGDASSEVRMHNDCMLVCRKECPSSELKQYPRKELHGLISFY